jgi:predicted DNA repair protein MutK
MKFLSVAGTAAMFLVGGSILVHGVPPLHHAIEHWAEAAGAMKAIVSTLLDGLLGVVAGALVLGVVTLAQRAFGRKAAA